MKIRPLLIPAFIFAAMATTLGYAQKLPPVSRTAFKCQVAGKTVYSDTPCLGAQQIDVEPTRGLNQTSGKNRVGTDVMKEQWHEAYADAIKPLTGMDAKQLSVQHRRGGLSTDAQNECRSLDAGISAAQQDEKNAAQSADLKDAQMKLYQLRKKFHELRC
jgi:hypothetical protein